MIGLNKNVVMTGGNVTKQLYLVEIEDGRCIMHDGYIQLGAFPHSAERHIEMSNAISGDNPINWQITYWMPDIWSNRYKRVSFQKTEKMNEGSPKTDNSVGYPSQAQSRLERTV